MSLLGGATLVLSGLIACGGEGTGDDENGAAGGLGSYTEGSAASQAPTAPGAKFPDPNPNASSSSSSSSTGGATDGGGSSSSSTGGSSSSSSSASSSGAPDGGGGDGG